MVALCRRQDICRIQSLQDIEEYQKLGGNQAASFWYSPASACPTTETPAADHRNAAG